MTLTMMCGLPNSGKTTKANNIAEETGAVIIRVDDYTYLYEQGYKPQQMLEIVHNDVRANLESGHDIIYDAVNATAVERQQLKNIVEPFGVRVVCVYMATPTEMCVSRDKHGWSSFYARFFEEPTEDEGFELIICKDGIEETEPTNEDIINALLGVIE